jgi:small subunit ribosomal protein S11
MSKLKKKQKKQVPIGIANIQTTFNNTIVTICDLFGNTLCWSSAGTSGFKGSRKNTAFAAQTAAQTAANKAKEMGMEALEVIVKGRGSGRESTLRAFTTVGLKIISIEDRTGVPHNGCRPPKKRRL